jgi:hypothetical protein
MMTNTEVQPNASNQGFRFVMLLLALLFLILVPPHFYQVNVLNQVWGLSTSLVMLVALYYLAGRRSAFLWLMILLVPSFIANWLQVLSDNRAALYADNVTTISVFFTGGFLPGALYHVFPGSDVQYNLCCALPVYDIGGDLGRCLQRAVLVLCYVLWFQQRGIDATGQPTGNDVLRIQLLQYCHPHYPGLRRH